jgi:hypothetical protein
VDLLEQGRGGVQSVADIVTVEDETVDPDRVQPVVDEIRHGTLPAGAEAGKPHHAPLMAVALLALLAGNGMLVPMDLNVGVVAHLGTCSCDRWKSGKLRLENTA